MAFQKPNQRAKDPVLWHSSLVKNGPKLVTILSAPKSVKNGELCVVDLNVGGVKHGYFIDTEDIKSGFSQYVGQDVVLIASGDNRQGTAKMEFRPTPVPENKATPNPRPVETPKAKPTPAPQAEKPSMAPELEAKKYLCQAANLMRLCVKKANDIAVELSLPPEHRQGIATTLFIQGDRRGFIDTMPLNAYTPEELGWGSSKACNLAEPEAENGDGEDF
jgi:hypothetical protein